MEIRRMYPDVISIVPVYSVNVFCVNWQANSWMSISLLLFYYLSETWQRSNFVHYTSHCAVIWVLPVYSGVLVSCKILNSIIVSSSTVVCSCFPLIVNWSMYWALGMKCIELISLFFFFNILFVVFFSFSKLSISEWNTWTNVMYCNQMVTIR